LSTRSRNTRDDRGSEDDPQALDIEVLSIRIGIDFERCPGLDRCACDAFPVA